MKFLCLLLPFLISACGRASASESNVISLSSFQQGDSTRVIASWKRPCDSRGCAESYKVIWRFRNGFKTTTNLSDTVWYATPRIGDTLLVSVTIHSIRRNLESPPRSAQIILRNVDSSPPPVDSVRVDTTFTVDSFPVEVSRMANGMKEATLAVGDTTFICRLARNVFTGQVLIVVDPSWTDREVEEVNQRCEQARVSYQNERDG